MDLSKIISFIVNTFFGGSKNSAPATAPVPQIDPSLIVLTLQRQPSGDEGTLGVLSGNGLQFNTGELPWRNNHASLSCIPAGTYPVSWTQSLKKKEDGSLEWPDGTYELANTSPRDGIRMHSGNFCGDTTQGWQSDVEGCILIGLATGFLVNKNNKSQHVILSSKPAVSQFASLMNKKPFTLVIKDAPAKS
jgi:hypothetical protein